LQHPFAKWKMTAMKSTRMQFLVLPLLLACCIGSRVEGQNQASKVRRAAVAGQFYPSDPAHLKLAVQQFLADARPAAAGKPIAIVVPHAGYLFAGQIIADAFSQAKGQIYDVVVILGTNHGRNQASAGLTGISVYANGAYETPLGIARVDEGMASDLLAEDTDCKMNPAPQENEHSIEVQVPFVQVLFPSAKILPVMIGMPDPTMCARLGRALAKIARDKRVLLVASSDLSHFPRYADASAVDRQTLESIARIDPAQFTSKVHALMSQGTPNLDTCACGEGPILAAMTAAKAMGAGRGVVVSYANSGDAIAEDRSRVVGYGSVAFVAGNGEPDVKALSRPTGLPPSGPLQAADKIGRASCRERE
jgi:AmmeMemoRadiSam system protein B